MITRRSLGSLVCTIGLLAAGIQSNRGVAAEPTISTSVTATIDAGKTYAPISAYVYGMFLEHIRNIINSGVWAEILDDRKFFNPIMAEGSSAVTAPAGGTAHGRGGRSGFGAPRRWIPIGPADAITMDSQGNLYIVSFGDFPNDSLTSGTVRGGAGLGMGEIYEVVFIPEPLTWTLALLGFGLLLWRSREEMRETRKFFVNYS